MKKIILGVFTLCLFTTLAFASQAFAQGKPTVLYIYGQYCGACKRFEPTFDSMSSKYSNKFTFEKEDYDSSRRARELHVTETPSVYILDNGKVQRIKDPFCFYCG